MHDVQESGKFAVIADEIDISRTEQVSLCLSYIADGTKKEAFIGFYATKLTEGEVLFELLKKAIGDLHLDFENIVGLCFDGAATMSGMDKGVATRMKECCPFALYVHCSGHLLSLAIQDTMTQIEPVRNALGTIQSLYNFLEASPKRHAIFADIQSDLNPIVRSLKSLSVTRWSCHWEHGRPQKFSRGGGIRRFAYLFQVVGDATQMDVHKKENVKCYGNSCIQ